MSFIVVQNSNLIVNGVNVTAVLASVNLTIAANQIIGLAGPSGSGKSTLLRCIANLEKADSGIIECSAKTGFMFQDFQLFPHMTVLDNLVYAPSLQDKTADHASRALSILEDLGISYKATDYPKNLSGGQKQRVALARSLMMHPNLLLCDEPTSGLDVATTLDVVTLLQSVSKKGVSMIIASHDLDFLTKIADRIILLKQGQIVLDVNPTELKDPIEDLKAFY